MKKEDVAGLFVYLIILAGAIIYGLVVVQPYYAQSSFDKVIFYALYILGALLTGILTGAICIELGHIIGAKVGKYSILSVNILYFYFHKVDNKFKFGFKGFEGLTGETKIMPKDEKSNPTPYLVFGTLFLAVISVLYIILFYVNKDLSGTQKDVGYFFLTSGVVSLVILFFNILPFKMDTPNDGYKLIMVSNPKNKEAFNELLRVEHALESGESDVEIKTFTEVTNFTAELNMNKVYLLLEKEKYEEAIELVDIVLKNEDNVSPKTYIRALSRKIELLTYSNNPEASKYVEENIDLEVRRIIMEESSFPSIRAYILISGLYDDSKSECKIALEKVSKAYKNTAKNRRNIESKLFNKCLDVVLAKHPKWEDIALYKIEEEKVEEKK